MRGERPPLAETVSSLADELSIVELKIYHMAEQAERDDPDEAFRARCRDRLKVLHLQRDDLAAELVYNDPQYRRPEP